MAAKRRLLYPVVTLAKRRKRTPPSTEDATVGRERAKLTLTLFGTVLREARVAANMSFATAARMASQRRAPISKSEMIRLEKGTKAPDALLVYVLAGLYKIDVQYLLEVLRWNTEHQDAEELPAEIPKEEGVMVIHGLEEEFVTRFRGLRAGQQSAVLSHMRFIEAEGQGAAQAEATFRKGRKTVS